MGLLQTLSVLALRGFVESAPGGEAASLAIDVLVERFTDHSQRLDRALRKANDRAWVAMEAALTGEGLLAWLGRSEDRELRKELRAFLDAELGGRPRFLERCVNELRQAREAGNLTGGTADPAALARGVGKFARFQDPQSVLDAEWRALGRIAQDLREAGYERLGELLELRPPEGRPPLLVALDYFFRRAVEEDERLARGLNFSLLKEVRRQQGRIEGQVEEIRGAVYRILERLGLSQDEVGPGDSLSIQTQEEWALVEAVLARYRQLPEGQQHRMPDLLSAVARLEVATGDFAQAGKDFAAAAGLTQDTEARGLAHLNAYRAALEERDWSRAFQELIEAVRLDGKRFAPFPVGKYQPRRILGAGGFGVAFLCRHKHLDADVVVKALHPDVLDRDVDAVFAEASALLHLEHPAIIRLLDCGYAAPASKSRPFLAMSHFPGETLEERVRQKPLPVADTLAIARLLAEGLQAAHAKGILHRDVKPANVLVHKGASGWEVKLIDFGLSLRLNAAQRQQQRGGTSGRQGHTLLGDSIVGTLDYAPPEQMGQVAGVPLGPYSDVYSFGRTCCYALFGTTWPRQQDWSGMPQPLAELINGCLAPHPADRTPTFAALLERWGALEPCYRGEWQCYRGHTEPVRAVALSPDGRLAASAGGAVRKKMLLLAQPVDCEVRLWEAVTGQQVRRFEGHKARVNAVCFSPDGQRLLSGADEGAMRLWDVGSGQTVRSFAGLTPSVSLLGVTALMLVPFVGFRTVERLIREEPDTRVMGVAFSPNGKLAVSACDGSSLRVWDTECGGQVRCIDGPLSLLEVAASRRIYPSCLALSPDGTKVVSGSAFHQEMGDIADRNAYCWDVSSGLLLRALEGHQGVVTSVAFTPDGGLVLTGSLDRSLRLWDVGTGKQVWRFDGHEGAVNGVACSANGRWVLSGSSDATVRLWRVQTGQEVRCFRGHEGPVWSVALSPTGPFAISGGEDATVRLWSLKG